MHSAQGTEQCVNTWQMFSQGDLVVVFFFNANNYKRTVATYCWFIS